jgi:hypothetical protein
VWKRNIRNFSKALLGASSFAKQCEIINPWVVNLKRQDGILTATAEEPILIANNALGYNLFYWRDNFKMGTKSLEIGGKSAFVSQSPNDAVQANMWDENRKESFTGSKQHFFKALVENRLKEEGFDVYLIDSRGGTLRVVRSLTANDLLIPQKDTGWVVKANDIIKVIYNKEKSPVAYLNDPMFSIEEGGNVKITSLDNNFSTDHPGTRGGEVGFAENTNQSSMLFFRSGKVELDQRGRLIDDIYLVEYGFWAWKRVGDLLPTDYLPEGFLSRSSTKPIQEVPRKNGFRLNKLLIPPSQIMAGGPPKDGIPAIDNPVHTDVASAKSLNDEDLILGVNRDGKQIAYPIRILNFHEVVNEKDFVVTYCPLCFSGIVFNNKVNEEKLSFGVSGLLYNSDVLMYDRFSESLWSQLSMKAISGKFSGTSLEIIPSSVTQWGAWKKKYPETKVLSVNTGYDRDYSYDPYGGYALVERTMFPVDKSSDKFSNKQQVVGVSINGKSRAYLLETIKEKEKIKDSLGGRNVEISYSESDGVKVKDNSGEYIPGTLMYWFAWFAFNPNTSIYR